jgi:hypothetical protein
MCEHQQDFGFECEQCGRDLGSLGSLGPPPINDQPLDGLEATVGLRVGEVPVDRVGELEVTRFSEVQVGADVTPDLELSRVADVGEVRVERLTEFSEDRAADDGVRTAAPRGVVPCRHCNTPGQVGQICARCGYKLPALTPVTPAGALKKPEAVLTRCRVCGAPATAGERCGDCGHEVAFPEA